MDVFVYGTLTERKTVEDVVSSYEFFGDAVLEGLKVVSGNYLTLGPAPGSEVEGKLLRTADIRSLDAYEGVESGLYVRVDVPGPDRDIALYVGDPERLAVSEPVEWPGSGSFEARVTRYLQEKPIQVRPRE
ncbi:gamma-glutamylcyclotransferase family protein [Haladaptatus sp. GCM10025707]|uniref:gamma-glutamylcyclotransferase family protein n=1 Tax=unclassified Haladaptatus TaxID=2622732 RepID=UPI0023E86B30|nr:gamma-glutamylcyclotransferase family protein [Haladaptatus sp. QDMS2]